MADQEIDNLQHHVLDLEGKLVKLAALEAAFVLSRWCILYYHMDYSNLT